MTSLCAGRACLSPLRRCAAVGPIAARQDQSSGMVIQMYFTPRQLFAPPASSPLHPESAVGRKAVSFSTAARTSASLPSSFAGVMPRRPAGKAYPDELRAQLRRRLVERQGHVRNLRRVSDDARVRVAEDVGLPLPAGRVGVARTNVLCLEAFELLLGSQLVRLSRSKVSAFALCRNREWSSP
jgi:hypothetical protein